VHAGSKPDANYGAHHPPRRLPEHDAYLTRLAPTFSSASRVILSGRARAVRCARKLVADAASVRPVRVDLIDDSGPPLPAPYLTETLEQTWRNAWNLAARCRRMHRLCGRSRRRDGLHGMQLPAIAPHCSPTRGTGHRRVLPAERRQRGKPRSAARGRAGTVRHLATLLLTGSSHTMLGSPGVSQNGVPCDVRRANGRRRSGMGKRRALSGDVHEPGSPVRSTHRGRPTQSRRLMV